VIPPGEDEPGDRTQLVRVVLLGKNEIYAISKCGLYFPSIDHVALLRGTAEWRLAKVTIPEEDNQGKHMIATGSMFIEAGAYWVSVMIQNVADCADWVEAKFIGGDER
jgi:hypothetical protein